MTLKVSVSGVRGVVGESLDAESLVRWAAAFGEWLPEGPVVVARDSRPSGPMVVAAVTAGLTSTGHDVIDAGMLTTPSTEMVVQESDAIGGVIVTASHNPVEWNALKLLRGDGLFLTAAEVDAVIERERAASRRHVRAVDTGQVRTRDDGQALHLDAILASDLIDVGTIRSRGLRVVVDAVEGAGGEILPALLDRLGVEYECLYCGCTGMFPRDPEPRADHLGELADRVRESGADLGLAVDPDVDRLALVDRGGVLLSEELTLAVAADHVLAQSPGPVVVNLSTTLALDAVAKRHGVQIHRAPVGEANVVARMLEVGARIGGEGNGGVILPALHAGRDAVLGAALVLAAVAARGSLGACLEVLPAASMVKDKLTLDETIDHPEEWRRAAGTLGPNGQWDESDGIRYALRDRWVHLRRSNTEPVLRIIAEAPSVDEARAVVDTVRGELGR
ncbi:MAG TPA: phosphoglucosamine mutase [Candidatus Krumholzibacteria bacterium]|nr:phosphoglucosamine mutase [Candidatus Krumholzibacteria bacterium]